jgi:hypothetical protein
MDMTKTAFGDAHVTALTVLDGQVGPAPRDVAELVRRCSRLDGRQGFRVVARGLSGHVFFERGRVIHAEFGEDCGLRAVVEMLRAGSVLLEPAGIWPSQPSLHLGPDLLLSRTGKDASRVVRKVDLPIEPPPLPDPFEVNSPTDRAGGALMAPVHPEALRSPPSRRAVSGIMPRMPGAPSHDALSHDALDEEDTPPRAQVLPPREALGPTLAKARAPNVASAAPAASPVRATERSARAPRLPEPPRQQATAPTPLPLPPADHAVTRAQRARSRSVVVARGKGASSRDAASVVAMPRTPIRAPRGEQPTTMVRIASRGELLAARGANAEQLAEAAAFIHGLANLIAADFGRQGRANVHLSGHGVSLLVARSEVNDIAAALGPTHRMPSLLSKVGLK